VIPDALARAALLERITALESALLDAQAAAAANAARAALLEQRLSELKRAPSPAGPPEAGRRNWLRRHGGRSPDYKGLGPHVERLLKLAEEMAGDILAVAQRDADEIRAAALSDAARIRTADGL
jgi:hypothetical protein